MIVIAAVVSAECQLRGSGIMATYQASIGGLPRVTSGGKSSVGIWAVSRALLSKVKR